MNIAAKAYKVCKSIKKPLSIPSKTSKDQKVIRIAAIRAKKYENP